MVMPRQIDIDDSGDNLSGTPHNNAWLQSLQDKIDVGLSNVLTFPAAAVPSADPNRLDDLQRGAEHASRRRVAAARPDHRMGESCRR